VHHNAIKVQNLSFSYPDGTKVLNNVSFEVHAGENMALLGHNGSGKTTLLYHLNGLLRGEGLIEICGINLSYDNLTDVRKKVGLVFEDPNDQLFCPTVFEDIAFGPLNLGLSKEEVKETVNEMLEQMEVSELALKSSHHLSLGQKKRVAIASVLAMRPQVLILDEPSSGLDPRGKKMLLDLLKKLEVTKLVVTHDLFFASALCSKAMVIAGGRIVVEGETRKILADKEMLIKVSLS